MKKSIKKNIAFMHVDQMSHLCTLVEKEFFLCSSSISSISLSIFPFIFLYYVIRPILS